VLKGKDKEILQALEEDFNKDVAELKSKLVDKLTVLVSGKTSQGVYDGYNEVHIPKKTKFTQKLLAGLDFLTINPNGWTTDSSKNDMIKEVINNYALKYKERLGDLNRKRVQATIGDELPTGIVKMAKVYVS